MSNTAPAEHEADAERIAQANEEIDQRVAQRVDAELAGLDLTDSERQVCRAEFYRQESGAVLRARGIDPFVFAEWRVREVHGR
ncbi:hypothetical protein REH65_33250 (plasmid) [Saccharopolyspora sp. ID03-671]|uniref:hypothetical protein n=1 Tax=Saccharopolyspora sp. ID03-671 TaxID=3073066 RepID=UPI0030F400CF